MIKSLIDIDIRKVSSIAGIFISIALPIASGNVPLDYVVPQSWIPYVQHDLGFLAFIAGALVGSQGVATLISPREASPPTK